jgi:transposase
MSKVTKAKGHLNNRELEKKIKQTVGFWRVQKWLIVYNALNYPRQSEEIAKHLAVSKSLVNKTISEYNRFGASSIETIGKGGRKNAYLEIEQEKDFINSYISKAQKGHIVTALEIKEGFEKLIGKKVHKTTIYRLLKRHNWRKLVPRSFHPKKDIEKQEAFKKTLKTKLLK